MKEFLMVFLVALFSDNYVMTKFFGTEPIITGSDDTHSSFGVGISVTLVLVLSTAIVWPIYTLLLLPFNLTYFNILIFVLVALAVGKCVKIVTKMASSKTYEMLTPYFPVITINSLVFGLSFVNTAEGFGFAKSVVNSFGAGIGFFVAILIFSGIRGRIKESHISKSFSGVPVTLVAAGITALAFSGFSGVVTNIFG